MGRSRSHIWDGEVPAPPTETRAEKLRQWLDDHGLTIYCIVVLTLLALMAIAYIMEN